ncbi:hem-containing dehydratase [Fusarium oxysporum f. sp. vasinfectum]|nr:hem-containing dehydratase [Fusarium oxysporum f. sp. vasinfectum]
MEKGMVSARACHAFAGEKSLGATNGTTTNGTPNGGIFPGLDYIRQAQILYWTDISKMEHMGRWDKGHVKLRRNFMSAYGPGGVMQGGDILLWVDLGIIKGDEIDAEYVGCYEGTGFLAFDKSAMLASRSVTAAELPPIFDKPVACQPIEW